MKIWFCLILLMFNCNEMLIAQQLNTPKDFQKIIAVSKINYGFQQTNNYQIRQPILENSPFQASVYTIDGQRKLQKFLKKGKSILLLRNGIKLSSVIKEF